MKLSVRFGLRGGSQSISLHRFGGTVVCLSLALSGCTSGSGSSSGQVATITTIAGDGTGWYSGDGGPATSAELSLPYGVALDSAGNVYIADTCNDVVRKVTLATGYITTVAGVFPDQPDCYGGAEGGDGRPATSTSLNAPEGVAVDSSGNLYIADAVGGRVRKVTASTGIISTYAGGGSSLGDGGPATSAELSGPTRVAFDSSGNLYIAGGYRIRKVTAATGIITTVAGNGTQGYSGDGGPATNAELQGARDVAVDGSGNLYIADSTRIRKVTAATGVISTIAGNGTLGFSGDGGPATSAELNQPYGIAVDNSGNVYIADSANKRIRKVTPAGVISTVAGDGSAVTSSYGDFGGDGGPPTSAALATPYGVALDGSGTLYIADTYNMRIRRVNF